MSPPDAPPQPESEPVFAAPWEAQAFALAMHLRQQGVFGWDEWSAALAAEIHRPRTDGEQPTYYEHWLAALERLVAEKNLTNPDELAVRYGAWDRATRATPHGQPILLANDPLARR